MPVIEGCANPHLDGWTSHALGNDLADAYRVESPKHLFHPTTLVAVECDLMTTPLRSCPCMPRSVPASVDWILQ